MHDVVIVGGGPVGLATALHAIEAGLDAVVVEPRQAPIDKACGEGIMPSGVRELAALGVHPDGMEISGIRYLDDRRAVDARFRDGLARGVRRTELHKALTERADSLGVQTIRGAADELRQYDDGVRVDVDGQQVHATYLIGADGLHSPIRRQLGLSSAPRTKRWGLRRHYACVPWTDHVEVHWGRDAEAYVTPVGPQLIGIAILTSRAGSFDEHLQQFAGLRARLTGLDVAGSTAGAGPLRQNVPQRVAGRVLLAGDAAGYVDALTGEGISIGLQQAKAAVHAVLTGDLASYAVDWKQITRRSNLLTRGLVAAISTPVVRRNIVGVAAALPQLFSAAVNALA